MGEGSRVAMSCGLRHRRSSDPALLWLWCRPAAVAPIRPLAWEPPYVSGAAPKSKKTQKTKNQKQTNKQKKTQPLAITQLSYFTDIYFTLKYLSKILPTWHNRHYK